MAIRTAGDSAVRRVRRPSIAKPSASFWFSLAATCVVILVPTLLVAVTVRVSGWIPHPVAMWLATGSLSAAILFAGTNWWMRQPGSTTMSFGELMVWRWVRRRRADEAVSAGSRILEGPGVQTRSGQLEVLRSLNSALETRDPYTRGHSKRVERHAYRTALAMHRSMEDVFNLRVAASLHDIGKIEVPIEVIRKQGPLDDTEWEQMKGHPAAGARMVANMGHEVLVKAVRHHHERWDGKGYPDRLSGEDIPLHARIIAVCDAFDAITSTRSYRSKSTRQKAIEIIKKESGKQFDPAVVDAFLVALPRGLPSLAALSWLSLPALQRGVAQIALIFKEAGVAGVAGAIATSSFAGAVAGQVVHPAKYLSRPGIERAQEAPRNKDPRVKRAVERAVARPGASFAAADGGASDVVAARVRGKQESLAAGRHDPTKAAAAKRESVGSTREEKTKVVAAAKPEETRERPAKARSDQADPVEDTVEEADAALEKTTGAATSGSGQNVATPAAGEGATSGGNGNTGASGNNGTTGKGKSNK